MTIGKICSKLNIYFPNRKAESWDKVGLRFGNAKQKIDSVLIALDLTKEVLDKAVENQVQLIIVHHPFIFKNSLEDEYVSAPYKMHMVDRLIKNNIGVLSIHTNFDNSSKGMSKAIAEKLNLKKYKKTKNKYGIYYQNEFSNKKIIFDIKNVFYKDELFKINIKNLKDTPIHVCLFPGSGSVEDIVKFHKSNNSTLFITSDIKHNEWIVYDQMGIDIIEIPHYIEDVFIEELKTIIQKSNLNIFTKYTKKYYSSI